jgi:hypothetical protein
MNSSGRPEPSCRELIWSAPSVASTTARMRSSLTPTSGRSKYTSGIFVGNSKTMPIHRVGCRRSAERATGWQTPTVPAVQRDRQPRIIAATDAPKHRSPFLTAPSKASARRASRSPPTIAEDTFKLMTASRAAVRSPPCSESTRRRSRCPKAPNSPRRNTWPSALVPADLPDLSERQDPPKAAPGRQAPQRQL